MSSRLARRVALTILIAQLYLLLAADVALVGAQTLRWSHLKPDAHEAARCLYRARILMTVTSDWMTFSIMNRDVWLYNLTTNVIQGQTAVHHLGGNVKNISLGKAPMDTTKVVFEVVAFLIGVDQVPDFNFSTTKGDIGYANVALYNYNLPHPSLIGSYNNTGTVPSYPGINLRRYSVDSRLVTAGGPVGTTTALRGIVPKLALAFYYPWYGNSSFSGLRHWQEGVTNQPLAGFYDSADPRLIEHQMDLAKRAGIDGFISSWWGIDDFTDTTLRTVMDVAEQAELNITVYYETLKTEGMQVDAAASEIENDLVYLLTTHSPHPAFLKLNGTPVIFLYACGAYAPEFWRPILNGVRQRAGRALFIGDTLNLEYIDVFDGFHTYNPVGILLRNEEMVDDTFASYHKMEIACDTYMKLWYATVLPGYDDRSVRSPGIHYPRGNGTTYEHTWGAAINSNPDGILICSWNEWHEGTEIEPSVEQGYFYIDMTRDLAQTAGLFIPTVTTTFETTETETVTSFFTTTETRTTTTFTSPTASVISKVITSTTTQVSYSTTTMTTVGETPLLLSLAIAASLVTGIMAVAAFLLKRRMDRSNADVEWRHQSIERIMF